MGRRVTRYIVALSELRMKAVEALFAAISWIIGTTEAVLDCNWRDVWRRWSARFNAIGLAIVGWMWFDPSAVLYVINLLPDEVRARLPEHAVAGLSAIFFVLAMIAQFVRQPKIEERRNGTR